MQEAGARTIAQDEASSVVWGMPGSAVKLGAADQVLSLRNIPPRLLELAVMVAKESGKNSGEAAMQSA
jgi:two-component system, chemotaxis family, protein-glutamate methylesterase/glutaminase